MPHRKTQWRNGISKTSLRKANAWSIGRAREEREVPGITDVRREGDREAEYEK